MSQTATPVKVPKNVFEGLEFVRKECLTNMFNINSVQRFAHQHDYHETVVWLDDPDNRKIYRDGMFRGFEPSEPPETNTTA
jgi:hypothetical protein